MLGVAREGCQVVPLDDEEYRDLKNHDLLIGLSRDVRWLKEQFGKFESSISSRFDKLEVGLNGLRKELRDEFKEEIKELDDKYSQEIQSIREEINQEIKPQLEVVKKETWQSVGYRLAVGALGGLVVLLGQVILSLLR